MAGAGDRLEGPIRVSALDVPTTVSNQLLRYLTEGNNLGYNGQAVLAVDTGSATVLLYESRDGQVCLDLQQNDMGGVGSCRAWADLEHKPLFLVLRASDANRSTSQRFCRTATPP